MTDNGTQIAVDADEAEWADLLRRVREDGRTIRVLSHGEPVAEVRPMAGRRPLGPLTGEPRLTISPDYDPTAGVPEEWWPDEMR